MTHHIHMATIKARNKDIAAAVPIVRELESASDFFPLV
jgi:hypothetical protein